MGNDSVKDKMKGGLNKAKGEVKDKVGDMTDKTDMQAEGKKIRQKARSKRVSVKRRINSQIKINQIGKARNIVSCLFYVNKYNKKDNRFG